LGDKVGEFNLEIHGSCGIHRHIDCANLFIATAADICQLFFQRGNPVKKRLLFRSCVEEAVLNLQYRLADKTAGIIQLGNGRLSQKKLFGDPLAPACFDRIDKSLL